LAQISGRAQQIDTTDQFSRFVESFMTEGNNNNSGGNNGGQGSLEQCFIDVLRLHSKELVFGNNGGNGGGKMPDMSVMPGMDVLLPKIQ
jgi:hypothetical protein